MNLILACSADGFLCRGPHDDMRWTGALDKFAFKLLTLSNDQPLFAGATTFDLMPNLPGRAMHRLSRKDGMSLRDANFYYPHGWIIGGPTVAERALKSQMIDRAFICRVPTMLWKGIRIDPIMELLPPAEMRVAILEYFVDIHTLETGNG